MGARRLSESTTRRRFLATTGIGAVGIGLAPHVAKGSASALNAGSADGLKLGLASYSLRNFARAYVIRAAQTLGTPYLNLKSFHQPYESTPEALAEGRAEVEAAGLKVVGGGTITLAADTDQDVRFYFEYARASGMPLMVVAPTRRTLPRIERFAAEYDIQVAVHNHGPEDGEFPGPQDVLPVVQDMDPRVGVCLDVGHTARTGIDVVEAAHMCGDRLLDVHMKDLVDLRRRESQCVVGEGAIPVARLFSMLRGMGYTGHVNLEYEIDPFDPLPGMQRSIAFMRGVLAGLDAAPPTP
jgi:sugar phosphate isomerase/epimerase